jgi:hypothetical protein
MHLDIYGDITYGIGMSLIFAGTDCHEKGDICLWHIGLGKKIQGILVPTSGIIMIIRMGDILD